jgi:GNAT superfamily N-acetyltransferase
MTLARARRLWCDLACARVEFPPRGVSVVVSPYSLLCPPGWCGVVVLGPSAIATVPTLSAKVVVEAALHRLPVASMTDPGQVRSLLPLTEMMGPAALAYVDPSGFVGPSSAAAEVPHDDPAVVKLLASVPLDDAGESGLDEITSSAFVTVDDGAVTAAAGWRRWPAGVAHLSVLTAPAYRGRGLGRAVAGRAVGDALAAGLFPQWRARPLASRRVAQALGFRELGAQLSFDVTTR